ncbi:AI-2E family transporter [Dokdonella sp. MW10]|uniref:AI-2E family transporter n=1 Tax=Dokdonella sp. MW10 TaxID=2992926 RepID=UPI003F816435
MTTTSPGIAPADPEPLPATDTTVAEPAHTPYRSPHAGAAMRRASHEAALDLNARIHRLLGIIVVGALLYTLYFASELILPILLAAFFALLLSPLMKHLVRRWLPRWIAALLLMALTLATFAGIVNALYPSAAEWASRAPQVLRDATPKIKALTRPLLEASRMSASLGEITGEENRTTRYVMQAPSRLSLLATTPRVLAAALAVVLLTYFFLLYGETLLRRFLLLRPTWAAKRLTVDIVRAIQNDVSRYFLTVCLTSIGLGAVTAAYLWMLGVETPLLWGALAALLNLTPYVGPMVMAALLMLIGLAQFPTLTAAALPAIGYLGLHTVESQIATPLVLGRTINLNPLAIILSLMVWGWLWGILGLLLAVPILVSVKIVCSRIESLQNWAVLLEK